MIRVEFTEQEWADCVAILTYQASGHAAAQDGPGRERLLAVLTRLRDGFVAVPDYPPAPRIRLDPERGLRTKLIGGRNGE